MSHLSSLSSIAANLAAHFSADTILAPRDLDATIRAWELDSPEPAPFDDADWAEYSEWSRTIDGGFPANDLTPAERDEILSTMTDREWREMLADDSWADRYDAARDCEDCFADLT